jgi:hypothetical protein
LDRDRTKSVFEVDLFLGALLLLGPEGGLLSGLSSSLQPTGTTSGNQTNLGTGWGTTPHSGGVTDMLMVTSSVRMVHGRHGNTPNLGPAVPLGLESVVVVTGLQDGLLNTSSSGADTNHGTAVVRDGLLLARWELDTGLLGIRVLRDDDGVSATGLGQSGPVTNLSFQVADNGTFRHGLQRQNVTDDKFGLLTAVDVLTRVATFGGNHVEGHLLKLEGVTELNLGKGGTTTGVMDNLLDYTPHVSPALTEVQRTDTGGTLSLVNMGGVDGTGPLPLCPDGLTHVV